MTSAAPAAAPGLTVVPAGTGSFLPPRAKRVAGRVRGGGAIQLGAARDAWARACRNCRRFRASPAPPTPALPAASRGEGGRLPLTRDAIRRPRRHGRLPPPARAARGGEGEGWGAIQLGAARDAWAAERGNRRRFRASPAPPTPALPAASRGEGARLPCTGGAIRPADGRSR